MVFIGLTPEGSDAIADSQAFIDRYGITWPNGYGAGDTIKALEVIGYPTVFVIGADGNIAWRDEFGGTLSEAIDQALNDS